MKKLHISILSIGLIFCKELLATNSQISRICRANDGLTLLNQNPPPLTQIHEILKQCQQLTPNDVQALLLRGLLARKLGIPNKNFQAAITWLEKAKSVATPDNFIPAQELAVTYEWAGQLEKAKIIYKQLLIHNPTSQAASQGLARIARAQKAIQEQAQKNISSKPKPTPCHANEGLKLLNQDHPPFAHIQNILTLCERETPNNVQVLLLHGLLARKQAMQNKNYQTAIHWLEKAKAAATPDNFIPALELAITYEWATQKNQAKALYKQILVKDPESRPALLGIARIAIAENALKKAEVIYLEFLKKNHHDVDALNGLGRMKLAAKAYISAKKYFQFVLHLQPKNKDARIGLEQLKLAQRASTKKAPPSHALALCPVHEGLRLLNQPEPPLPIIQNILFQCDQKDPMNVQVLMLHGLFARKIALMTKNFNAAIYWFQMAKAIAEPNNLAPALELAVTYEWAEQTKNAKIIYYEVLQQDPHSRAAWLGLARVARAQYHLKEAAFIYDAFLQKNPIDTDALKGIAWIYLTDKKFKKARHLFETVLSLKPDDEESKTGIDMLNNTTRYRLSVLTGQYSVGGQVSYSGYLNFVGDINATDQILIFANHNTKELQLGFFTDPTLLPKNSLLLGFQRQIPFKYGWGINYEYRQHGNLPDEHRVAANLHFFFFPGLKWFGGVREGFPSPWNNQLYYSGLLLLTKLPVNFSVTGFWGQEQIGGHTSAYSFDLSKEFANRTYYMIGAAYSPTVRNWDVHSVLILTLFKNQAIEGSYEHYFFNGGTRFTIGWRTYW
jgi:Tfp pilus assembly protein PilF